VTDVTPEVDLPDLVPAAEVGGIGRRGRAAVMQLALRTGLLRVVSLIGTVLLARILAPADFGVFAVIVLLTSALTPFGDLGLGATLIQRREPPTERDIATAFTAQQVMWLILLVIGWLAAPLIRLAGPDMPADAEWMIRVAAVAVYVNQLRSVPVSMMSRVLRFGPLAAIEVVQQVAYAVVAVGLALSGAGAWSFVIALLAQFSLGALLTYIAWGDRPHIGIDRVSLRNLLGFSVTFQATYILSLFREALVPAFGGLAGGVSGIGYLNFGQRFGRLLGSVDEIVSRVAFPAFSRLQGDASRRAQALVHVVEMTALAFGFVLCWAIAVAPTLIEVAFSATWLPATAVFQLTAVAVLISLPATFMRIVAYSMGLARPMLIWTLIPIVVTFAVFPLLLIGFGLLGGGIGFVVFALVQLLGMHWSTHRLAPFPWSRLARIYAIAALAALCGAASLLLVGALAGLILSGLVSIAAYAALLFAFERAQIHRSWRVLRGDVSLEAA
jgi:PST family polysaccharide transporter